MSRRHKPPAAHTPAQSTAPSSPARPGSAPGTPTASNCQATFVPAYFYASSQRDQAIDTKPDPGVLLLNVDNGVGTAPLSHFQTLVKQAQDDPERRCLAEPRGLPGSELHVDCKRRNGL
jgi:hypothetical protein